MIVEQRRVEDWCRRVVPHATPRQATDKVIEEYGELLVALAKGEPTAILEEFADSIIAALAYGVVCGVDVAAAVSAKLDENDARTWEIAANGTARWERGCPDGRR
jgi:phosphoribosyl-ATP pyrophosphohydrolase